MTRLLITPTLMIVKGLASQVAIVSALLAGTAGAESSTGAATTSPSKPPATTHPRSRAVAFGLSAAGTLAPLAVFAGYTLRDDPDGGIIFGVLTGLVLPAAGHWYAGRAWSTGTGLRLAGFGTATVAGLLCVQDASYADEACGVAVVGLGVMGLGAIWDVVTAGSAIDRWNRQHTVVAPTVTAIGDGYGIGVVGRY